MTGVLLSIDLARVIVYWLGRYASLSIDRNGCLPDGLADAQHDIADAVLASRPREASTGCGDPRIPSIAGTDADPHGPACDVDTAASVLEIEPTTVRWHLTHGRLNGRKFHGRWYVTIEELHRFQQERTAR